VDRCNRRARCLQRQISIERPLGEHVEGGQGGETMGKPEADGSRPAHARRCTRTWDASRCHIPSPCHEAESWVGTMYLTVTSSSTHEAVSRAAEPLPPAPKMSSAALTSCKTSCKTTTPLMVPISRYDSKLRPQMSYWRPQVAQLRPQMSYLWRS
jgi:hypothetical protein